MVELDRFQVRGYVDNLVRSFDSRQEVITDEGTRWLAQDDVVSYWRRIS